MPVREVVGGGSQGRVLREKGFSEVAKLSRGQDQWDDWSYDFKIATGTMSTETKRILEMVEGDAKELNSQDVIDIDGDV